MPPEMTAEAFRARLEVLGLGGHGKQGAAARTLGVTPRCVRHWETGKRRVTGPVVVLLEVLCGMVGEGL